jgi:hypothetical protein
MIVLKTETIYRNKTKKPDGGRWRSYFKLGNCEHKCIVRFGVLSWKLRNFGQSLDG